MPSKQQELMAWCPQALPPELAAVRVPKGSSLEEAQWVEALATRVQGLVDKEPDPDQAALQAVRTLDRPGLRGTRDAGQVLVTHNWELLAALRRQMVVLPTEPFPAKALVETEVDKRALRETDLETWVDLAAAWTSESSLD